MYHGTMTVLGGNVGLTGVAGLRFGLSSVEDTRFDEVVVMIAAVIDGESLPPFALAGLNRQLLTRRCRQA